MISLFTTVLKREDSCIKISEVLECSDKNCFIIYNDEINSLTLSCKLNGGEHHFTVKEKGGYEDSTAMRTSITMQKLIAIYKTESVILDQRLGFDCDKAVSGKLKINVS